MEHAVTKDLLGPEDAFTQQGAYLLGGIGVDLGDEDADADVDAVEDVEDADAIDNRVKITGLPRAHFVAMKKLNAKRLALPRTALVGGFLCTKSILHRMYDTRPPPRQVEEHSNAHRKRTRDAWLEEARRYRSRVLFWVRRHKRRQIHAATGFVMDEDVAFGVGKEGVVFGVLEGGADVASALAPPAVALAVGSAVIATPELKTDLEEERQRHKDIVKQLFNRWMAPTEEIANGVSHTGGPIVNLPKRSRERDAETALLLAYDYTKLPYKRSIFGKTMVFECYSFDPPAHGESEILTSDARQKTATKLAADLQLNCSNMATANFRQRHRETEAETLPATVSVSVAARDEVDIAVSEELTW